MARNRGPAPGTEPRGRGARTRSSRERLAELRGRRSPREVDRLFLATLRVRIPSGLWPGPFSAAHPELRIDVLNRVEVTPDLSVSDHWISGGPPGIWTQELMGYPDVLSVEPFAEVGAGCLYRLKYRNPPVIYLYREMNLPLHFPLRVQAGYISWEIAARYSEFRKILRHARQTDPGAQIVSIRRGPLRSHLPLLTDTQRQLLAEAMAAGYFAVPRGITLTELARRLNRSKSGLSEAIALIEKKLLEAAFQNPTAPS